VVVTAYNLPIAAQVEVLAWKAKEPPPYSVTS